MSVPFQPGTGPIIVEAEVAGPAATFKAVMILDTGATVTSLSPSVLRLVGYDPTMAVGQAQVTTGSGISTSPLFTVNRLSALGQHAIGLRIVARNLPATAAADGLLGLDFMRGRTLTIDFSKGQISLH